MSEMKPTQGDVVYISPADLAALAHCGLSPVQLVEMVKELKAALKQISEIEDQMYGADWEEIEEAREIADAALAKCEGVK